MGKLQKGLVVFVLEDDFHGDQIGHYDTFEAAMDEVRKRAELGWEHPLNSVPCGNDDCQRDYCIVEYNTHSKTWKELGRKYVMSISAKGVEWLE